MISHGFRIGALFHEELANNFEQVLLISEINTCVLLLIFLRSLKKTVIHFQFLLASF